jgi:hypothetical protein
VTVCETGIDEREHLCLMATIDHSNEIPRAIADCLEKQFLAHELCDDRHERRLENEAEVTVGI